MANRLLDRQVSLLEYLTSGAAIFGKDGGGPLGQALHGIDRGLLGLEARFSYEKRMDKVLAIFPRTFDMLGGIDAAVAREFAEACPPTSITRLDNARQFYNFVSARWQREPPTPPYLPDVAACELACAAARAGAEQRPELAEPRQMSVQDGIRRRPGVVLLRCAYDIRPIFEQALPAAAPSEHDTPLAVVIPPGADQPRVFELRPVVFDLLATLDDWTDPAEFGATPELKELIDDLAEHGLIEVRR